ncbi:MAG: cytochrome c [Planctomycetota bacterium]
MKRFLKDLDLDFGLPKPPPWLIGLAIVLGTLPLMVGSVIIWARATKSPNPRLHLWQDMDHQPRYDPQQPLAIFADGRAMRPRVNGTIARGMLRNDDHYYRGFYVDPDGQPVLIGEGTAAVNKFYEGYPEQITVDERLLKRGKDLYMQQCYSCHGVAGQGNGPTHVRGAELNAYDANNAGQATGTNWVAPTNITLPTYYASVYPNGQLYSTINHGKGNMRGLGHQIAVEDRWAIVAYVRALQLAQDADQTLGTPAAVDPDNTANTPPDPETPQADATPSPPRTPNDTKPQT